ncbi:hypothetical protein KDL44_12375 [bacterium]|nr:hypothetical protein [bacterium]
MKHSILTILAFLALATSVAQARDPYAGAIVPGDLNPTIEVVPLDDPSNPYRDSYTQMDYWAFNNFAHHMTDQNCVQTQRTTSEVNDDARARGLDVEWITRRSVVELDPSGTKGYLVPVLSFLNDDPGFAPRTLGEAFYGSQQATEPDTRPYFWSLGVADELALAEYDTAVRGWLAPAYPSIADWMIDRGMEGDKYFFLPDGGLVIATPEVKGDFSQRKSVLSRYDQAGQLLQQESGDYMSWERILLYQEHVGRDSPYYVSTKHYDVSGGLTGVGNNLSSTGRYTAYRDPDSNGFLAVVDYWQGKILTPADADLTQLPLDPYPVFNMQDYEEVLRIYRAQQGI